MFGLTRRDLPRTSRVNLYLRDNNFLLRRALFLILLCPRPVMGNHALENDSNTSDGSPNHKLTEEEASRYDRQMRLWGLEAQQRCISIGSSGPKVGHRY